MRREIVVGNLQVACRNEYDCLYAQIAASDAVLHAIVCLHSAQHLYLPHVRVSRPQFGTQPPLVITIHELRMFFLISNLILSTLIRSQLRTWLPRLRRLPRPNQRGSIRQHVVLILGVCAGHGGLVGSARQRQGTTSKNSTGADREVWLG